MRWHMCCGRWNGDAGVGGVMEKEVEVISCSWNQHLTDSSKKLEREIDG